MTEEDKRAEAELSRGCMSCTTGCGVVLAIFLVLLVVSLFLR